MGFFNAFKNIILGKPVFEATQPPSKKSEAGTQAHAPQSGHAGPKVIPQMFIERINCHTSGSEMEVDAIIQNYSHEELLLDKIVLLGQTHLLNAKLVSPGEEDDITAFSGHRPTNTYDSQCLLYYKNEAGDYFCSVHTVEFEKLPDNTQAVKNIRFSMIRDV
ncbi:MAG TPA: hypothetical protein VM581_05120 [Magnetospirillaceae bacterium]|nr:hypothetical protein [Magnetospirillaceae bacterium]